MSQTVTDIQTTQCYCVSKTVTNIQQPKVTVCHRQEKYSPCCNDSQETPKGSTASFGDLYTDFQANQTINVRSTQENSLHPSEKLDLHWAI